MFIIIICTFAFCKLYTMESLYNKYWQFHAAETWYTYVLITKVYIPPQGFISLNLQRYVYLEISEIIALHNTHQTLNPMLSRKLVLLYNLSNFLKTFLWIRFDLKTHFHLPTHLHFPRKFLFKGGNLKQNIAEMS